MTIKKPSHPTWDEKVYKLSVVPPGFRVLALTPAAQLASATGERRNALLRPVTGPRRTHYCLCAGVRGVSFSLCVQSASSRRRILSRELLRKDMSRICQYDLR